MVKMNKKSFALFCYPWDIIDEGYDAIIDAVKRSGLNSIYVTVNYHSGMFFLPHSKKRKIYFPEPGALYFNPSNWHKNHTFQSPISNLTENWPKFWEELSNKCKQNNINLCAWMLGTHNSGIGNKYQEISVHNAWGDPITHSLCPFNSEVVDHFVNVSKDVVNLGVFDKILVESLEYLPLRHGHHHEVIGVDFPDDLDFLMSLNFSRSCMDRLKNKNVDGEIIKNWVKKISDDYFNKRLNNNKMDWQDFEKILDGQFWQYYLIREESITNINKAVINELRQDKNLKIGLLDFGPLYSLGPYNQRWQNGVNLEYLLPLIDEIHPTFYFADLDFNKKKYEIYKDVIKNKVDMIPAIRTILPQTSNQKDLTNQIEIFNNDAAGFSFYNYSFMNFENLDWINKSLSLQDNNI